MIGISKDGNEAARACMCLCAIYKQQLICHQLDSIALESNMMGHPKTTVLFSSMV